jgi:cytosine/uracil/thiamine/allantoin permease
MILLETHATELVGYLAMLLLLISFLMKDIRHLRKLNTVACTLFVAYGFMLSTSWPIIISNASIMGINIYYLFFKKN